MNESVGSLQNFNDLQALQSIKNEPDQDKALRKVAQEFESIFINMMLKSMREANAVFEDDTLSGGEEGGVYRDMYDQQLALSMAHGKGLGIADALYRQMSSQYGKQPVGDLDNTIPVDRKLAPGVNNASPVAPQSKPDDPGSPREFMQKILPIAEKAAAAIGVNPLVMVAQAALETGWGKHVIRDQQGNSSNNLFNIKADRSWQGESMEVSTREFREGRPVMEKAAFRRYDSIAEGVDDFVRFIQENPRYGQALELAGNANGFVQALQKAGYATDPDYARKVLSVLDRLKQLVGDGAGKLIP